MAEFTWFLKLTCRKSWHRHARICQSYDLEQYFKIFTSHINKVIAYHFEYLVVEKLQLKVVWKEL